MGFWSIKQVASKLKGLSVAEGREAESLAQWIWEDIMGLPIHVEKELREEEEKKIRNVIDRVVTGEPIQYIAGHAWFYGLKLKVTPSVLIPRPETEELVHWVLEDLRKSDRKEFTILDIGTGSGCIPIILKKQLGNRIRIVGIDISPEALNIARDNAKLYETNIEFIEQDFLKQGLEGLGKFDVIISNPPYISKSLAGEEIIKVLKYEPTIALFPDQDDPDIFYKRVAGLSMESLHHNSMCYLEMNEFRADQIRTYFTNPIWAEVEIRKDLQGKDRLLKAEFSA
jgi:release factor glutamine methyltransferase